MTNKYRPFAARVSQLKIWHFFALLVWKETFADALFNRYSVIAQFAGLAAGEQLCHRCTHRKL
jgi:hypothetical protein